MKTFSQRVTALKTDIRFTRWDDRDCRVCLLKFCRLVELLAPGTRKERSARCALHHICRELGQLIGDPVAIAAEGLFTKRDMYRVNAFASRILEQFGVFESVVAAFPSVQEGDKPLFPEDAWLPFWHWAAGSFFRLDVVLASLAGQTTA